MRYGHGSEDFVMVLPRFTIWIFTRFSLAVDQATSWLLYFLAASGGTSIRYGHGSELLTLLLAFLRT